MPRWPRALTSSHGASAFVAAVAARGGGRVHVKLDTGMGRLGTRDPRRRRASRAPRRPSRRRAGRRDDPLRHRRRARDDFFGEQLERFAAWAARCASAIRACSCTPPTPPRLLRDAASHFDLVRPGVAIYGLDPFQEDAAARDLEPALELRSYVAEVKPCAPGESAGYGGASWPASDRLATVPIGYGDGVRRALTNNADVLVGGGASRSSAPCRWTTSPSTSAPMAAASARRRGAAHRRGAARRGDGAAPGTINYEVTCGLTARVPRRAPPRRGGAVIETLREALAGERAWLVGRRAARPLLGRPTPDLDVVVDGDVRRRRAQPGPGAGGASFELSDQFGAWRVVARDRSWQVDITPLQGGSLEADLGARDLTVNAWPSRWRRRARRPHGGARGPRPQRPARWSAPRPFARRPAAHAARGAPGAPSSASRSSPTPAGRGSRATRARWPRRLSRARLRRAAAASSAPMRRVRGLRSCDELDLAAAVLPELDALRGVEQNPYHHRDVHGHTLEVLQASIDSSAIPRRRWATSRSPSRSARCWPSRWPTSSPRRRCCASARCCTTSPSRSTRTELPDGRIGFPAPRRAGRRDGARRRSSACAPASGLRAHVAALTRHHLRLGFLVHQMPLDRRELYRYLVKTEPVEADVTLLSVADGWPRAGARPTRPSRHLELGTRWCWPRRSRAVPRGRSRRSCAATSCAASWASPAARRLGELMSQDRGGALRGRGLDARDEALALARAARGASLTQASASSSRQNDAARTTRPSRNSADARDVAVDDLVATVVEGGDPPGGDDAAIDLALPTRGRGSRSIQARCMALAHARTPSWPW
jgi:hypothetical protein